MDKYDQPPPYEEHMVNAPVPRTVPKQQQQNRAVQLVRVANLGPTPARYVCHFCHADITTSIRHEPSTKTHLWAVIGCLLGGLCCVFLPYCIDSCQNANHYCPACQAYLGAYEY